MKNSETGAWLGLSASLIGNFIQKGRNESLESQNGRLTSENVVLQKSVRKLEIRVKELEKVVETRDKQLEVERVEKGKLQKRAVDAEGNVVGLTAKNSDLEERLEGSRRELAQREVDLAREREQHETAKERCRVLEQEVDRLHASRREPPLANADPEENVA